jgi:hypothetical protein
MRVAGRMPGSDVEDVAQEAFIRWMGVDREEIREPEAFRVPQPANHRRPLHLPADLSDQLPPGPVDM